MSTETVMIYFEDLDAMGMVQAAEPARRRHDRPGHHPASRAELPHRRRIAALMAALGAQSRFQAGVQANRSGRL